MVMVCGCFLKPFIQIPHSVISLFFFQGVVTWICLHSGFQWVPLLLFHFESLFSVRNLLFFFLSDLQSSLYLDGSSMLLLLPR